MRCFPQAKSCLWLRIHAKATCCCQSSSGAATPLQLLPLQKVLPVTCPKKGLRIPNFNLGSWFCLAQYDLQYLRITSPGPSRYLLACALTIQAPVLSVSHSQPSVPCKKGAQS